MPRANCGHRYPRPRRGTGAAGYETDQHGYTWCYPCAIEIERADMATADRCAAYLDGRRITTWTGGVLGTVNERWSRPVRRGYVSRETVYVRVVDVHGGHWHGRGPGDDCYVRLHRSRVRHG